MTPLFERDKAYLQRLTQTELELAWLGSIFFEAEYCRSLDPDHTGTLGLRREMFTEKEVFTAGKQILGHGPFAGFREYGSVKELSDELLAQLLETGLFAALLEADRQNLFMASFFEKYAREIEARYELRQFEEST